MALNNEIKAALEKIANGKSIEYFTKARVKIDEILIHCRFVSKGQGINDKERFSFGINENTLTAQYELWVCASSDWYYLIPTNIINDIYNDPDTYVNKFPGQEKIKTVGVLITEDTLKYGRDKSIQISKYFMKTI